jgi:hypothetical protein
MSYYCNNSTITETRVSKAFLRGELRESLTGVRYVDTHFNICEEVTKLGHGFYISAPSKKTT